MKCATMVNTKPIMTATSNPATRPYCCVGCDDDACTPKTSAPHTFQPVLNPAAAAPLIDGSSVPRTDSPFATNVPAENPVTNDDTANHVMDVVSGSCVAKYATSNVAFPTMQPTAPRTTRCRGCIHPKTTPCSKRPASREKYTRDAAAASLAIWGASVRAMPRRDATVSSWNARTKSPAVTKHMREKATAVAHRPAGGLAPGEVESSSTEACGGTSGAASHGCRAAMKRL
mmetsp:Transcript_20032/g.62219  ORF Transcript_20032/g.62219 Transcript_20032/m.62219 type:complete len:230 (+) Transcript_20032:564-1253(+)